ncbi:MAG TPA: hypothetical protein VGR51_02610 [Thermoplasmata archaeon]|nr:hypothetical protein [Thermoplasmata archaeon]
MARDVGLLHDYLWMGWKGDTEALRADLVRDARGLDAFLGSRGALRRPAEALAARWGRGPQGASLFELLHDSYHLTAATEDLRKGDPKRAARHVADAVESLSIGLCSAAGRFDLVEQWERRGGDFETFMGELADFLERKGVTRAGEYKRLMLAARTVGRKWDGRASPMQRSLAARGALGNAAWCAVATGTIRRALRVPRLFSETDYGAVMHQILERL